MTTAKWKRLTTKREAWAAPNGDRYVIAQNSSTFAIRVNGTLVMLAIESGEAKELAEEYYAEQQKQQVTK